MSETRYPIGAVDSEGEETHHYPLREEEPNYDLIVDRVLAETVSEQPDYYADAVERYPGLYVILNEQELEELKWYDEQDK